MFGTKWVIITESPVDAIIATQYGFPAISLNPSALSWDDKLTKYLAHLDRIYLAFDNDVAGRRGVRRVGKRFKSRVRFIDWAGFPYKYDVGNLLNIVDGKQRLQNLLDTALPYGAIL